MRRVRRVFGDIGIKELPVTTLDSYQGAIEMGGRFNQMPLGIGSEVERCHFSRAGSGGGKTILGSRSVYYVMG